MTENHQIELEKASQICKQHIFFLHNSEALDRIEFDKMAANIGNFAFVFKENLDFEQVKNLLKSPKLKNVLNAVIFVPNGVKYSIFAKNSLNEVELVNIWQNETFLLPNGEIFPKNRFKNNLNNINIKATSFQYAPFIYKLENGAYSGYEINLLNDISGALNFTYQIQPPSDGNLWGEILSNGTATGLVGDIQKGVSDIGKYNKVFTQPKQ